MSRPHPFLRELLKETENLLRIPSWEDETSNGIFVTYPNLISVHKKRSEPLDVDYVIRAKISSDLDKDLCDFIPLPQIILRSSRDLADVWRERLDFERLEIEKDVKTLIEARKITRLQAIHLLMTTRGNLEKAIKYHP